MNFYKVTVLPETLQIQVPADTPLKQVLIDNGIDFEFPCGGLGVCKRCKLKIIKSDGQVQDVLACQYKVNEDITVKLHQRELKHGILSEGIQRHVTVDALIKKVYFELPRPSLSDNRDDWRRLINQKGIKTSLKVLQDLPENLRRSDFKITTVLEGDKVIAVENHDTTHKLLGMAFDIGTTTIAGYLIDLKTGNELCKVSSLNPQTKFGADVISRISFASESPEGLYKLHSAVVDEINNLIQEAVKQTKNSHLDIYAVTFAGNTTMHHLLLKILPKYLARAPYVPVVTEPVVVDAAQINIKINPEGRVFTFPNIAGFVGGDTVAAALAAELDKASKLKLLVDIGTNGEIVLGRKGKYLACSTAAGPAFEGVQISCGMRGASGAIDHVSIGEEYKYTVIGNTSPEGLAGSGIVDTVAELIKVGIVDKKGRLLKAEEIKTRLGQKYKDKITSINGILAFVIAEGSSGPVYINQKDIREFQLAKGAIAAGIEILLKAFGANTKDIDEVFLAGAFGNYLNPESACAVGLIPKELEDRIKGIGNAAGVGAKLAVISYKEYERAVNLSRKIEYIELSSHPEFNSTFFNKVGFE
ncbi:MAG: DUF4445 domain-containing protein [Thermoanaerobacteraceae bacterium]|nr:DUF4445 domain-containing protein [Thermoanaerobacteraceae bacterium]